MFPSWLHFNQVSMLPQEKLHLQQNISPRTTSAGGDVRPQSDLSPASGFPSLLTLMRSAGRGGSSPPADTTPTTAEAPARSRWAAPSEPPTTPRCAPSCTRSNSPATTWERRAAFPTDSSPSVCCTLTTRRTWF